MDEKERLLREINEREKQQEIEKRESQKFARQTAGALVGCTVAPMAVAFLLIAALILWSVLGR